MSKAIRSLVILSALSLLSLPQTVKAATAYDMVCEYKYRIGEGSWALDSSQGTTRSSARQRRTQDIKFLERKAQEAGQPFEVIYLFCRDPWGSDFDSD